MFIIYTTDVFSVIFLLNSGFPLNDANNNNYLRRSHGMGPQNSNIIFPTSICGLSNASRRAATNYIAWLLNWYHPQHSLTYTSNFFFRISKVLFFNWLRIASRCLVIYIFSFFVKCWYTPFFYYSWGGDLYYCFAVFVLEEAECFFYQFVSRNTNYEKISFSFFISSISVCCIMFLSLDIS